MESEDVPNYNNLWEIANLAFDELKKDELKEKEKIETKKNKNCCSHLNICEDVCIDCGVCITNLNLSSEGEWNNYKDNFKFL